jgi:Uma2 family endonuclease
MATQVATPEFPLYRFSVEDVIAMVEAGILDEHARVELIDGVLVEMSPTSPRHSDVVAWLIAHIAPAARGRFQVRVQDTLLTPSGGYFEPDLFVIEPTRGRLPDRALLVVEVAYTSRRHDLWKSATYAVAGVPDYWIVDVDRNEVLVHREPGAEGYARVERYVAGDVITPLIDVPPVDVSALLVP